ncbi:DDE domain-containing protein [Shewanella maritima]|uniref:DDE domain-containing protein n=1 Tax=Shewanella maritima TaxID=2520507 RepID=A0A411PMS4_9GAMM|nr:DDE domain-containing protein [Shewanella maritima]
MHKNDAIRLVSKTELTHRIVSFIININRQFSYTYAVGCLKKEERQHADVKHRKMKYLNNGTDSDLAPIKKLVEVTGGFKRRKRTWSTLQGFESLRSYDERL